MFSRIYSLPCHHGCERLIQIQLRKSLPAYETHKCQRGAWDYMSYQLLGWDRQVSKRRGWMLVLRTGMRGNSEMEQLKKQQMAVPKPIKNPAGLWTNLNAFKTYLCLPAYLAILSVGDYLQEANHPLSTEDSKRNKVVHTKRLHGFKWLKSTNWELWK